MRRARVATPVGTFTIADPQNWVALFAFLTVALVASNLSSVARDRADEATARRDEVARLFDLSRDVLLMTDNDQAISQLARFIARRFDLDYTAICLPRATGWQIAEGGPLSLDLDRAQLQMTFAGASRFASARCSAAATCRRRRPRRGVDTPERVCGPYPRVRRFLRSEPASRRF